VEQPDGQGRHWGIEAVDWRQSRLKAPRLAVQNRSGGTFSPGLPLVARAQPGTRAGGNSFDLKLATASGAPVASVAVNGKRTPAPTLKVLNSAGRQVASQSFEYG
jgi:hypothetical protein